MTLKCSVWAYEWERNSHGFRQQLRLIFIKLLLQCIKDQETYFLTKTFEILSTKQIVPMKTVDGRLSRVAGTLFLEREVSAILALGMELLICLLVHQV